MSDNDDKYAFDPNSGATPQPGGYAAGTVVTEDDEPTDVGADLDSLDDADDGTTGDGADASAGGAGGADAGGAGNQLGESDTDNGALAQQDAVGDQGGQTAQPNSGASRDEWVKWCKNQPNADADDFKPLDQGGKRRDELAAKYGSQS